MEAAHDSWMQSHLGSSGSSDLNRPCQKGAKKTQGRDSEMGPTSQSGQKSRTKKGLRLGFMLWPQLKYTVRIYEDFHDVRFAVPHSSPRILPSGSTGLHSKKGVSEIRILVMIWSFGLGFYSGIHPCSRQLPGFALLGSGLRLNQGVPGQG